MTWPVGALNTGRVHDHEFDPAFDVASSTRSFGTTDAVVLFAASKEEAVLYGARFIGILVMT